MRLTLATAVACLTLTGLALAAESQASIKKPTNIPAQALGSALLTLEKDRNMEVIFVAEDIRDVRTQGASGELTPQEALEQLLAGTGLTYRFMGDKTITILPARPLGSSTSQDSAGESDAGHASGSAKSWWQRLRLAQTPSPDASAATGGTAQSAKDENNPSSASREGGEVAEIVVTAQKRLERLQDVPVPVSVIDAQALANNNKVLLRDYLPTVPGVNLAPGGQGVQTIAIRGITTGTGNPTVAVLIDGVTYNQATNIAGGRVVPDFDPGDLARIELLRGPQGTLYGAASLGGLLNFVTRDPSPQKLAGRFEAGINSVRNGEDPGYNLRGSVNVPLADTFAIRASAFSRLDAGFIDDPSLGLRAINDAHARGGRLAGLWSPSDKFSLRLSAIAQRIKSDGASTADLGLGDLEQSRVKDSGTFDRKSQFYSAIAKAKLGRVDATSITGYSVNTIDAYEDSGTGTSTALAIIDGRKFTQELQFSVPLGNRFEWLLGAVYTDEDGELDYTGYTADRVSGAKLATQFNQRVPTTLEEYAGFTDLTVHFTDRFDVQAGLRRSEIRQTSATINSGVPNPALDLKVDTSATTYLFTPRFKVTQNLMVYARMASGYRIGGPNAFSGGVIPAAFDPDKTQNYEAGAKGAFLDGALTIDASLYYIDWKEIQFNLLNPVNNRTYTANGSDAKSQGLELAVEVRPVQGLTIGGWIAFDTAELTEDFPVTATAIGRKGDRLPYSARESGHLSVRQEFPLWNDFTGFVGGAFSYVGDRVGPFRAGVERQPYPSYTQLDLDVGLTNDKWLFNIFATNLGDKRGVINGGLGVPSPTQFHYITPRTVGMSISRSF